MSALDPQVHCAAAEADELLIQNVANAAERFQAEVLMPAFHAVDGRLAGAEAPGKLSLSQTSFLSQMRNEFANFLVRCWHN